MTIWSACAPYLSLASLSSWLRLRWNSERVMMSLFTRATISSITVSAISGTAIIKLTTTANKRTRGFMEHLGIQLDGLLLLYRSNLPFRFNIDADLYVSEPHSCRFHAEWGSRARSRRRPMH